MWAVECFRPFVSFSTPIAHFVFFAPCPSKSTPKGDSGHFQNHWYGTKCYGIIDTIHQWFLTGGGASMNFQWGGRPYAPYNLERLLKEFTN